MGNSVVIAWGKSRSCVTPLLCNIMHNSCAGSSERLKELIQGLEQYPTERSVSETALILWRKKPEEK